MKLSPFFDISILPTRVVNIVIKPRRKEIISLIAVIGGSEIRANNLTRPEFNLMVDTIYRAGGWICEYTVEVLP